MKRLEEFEKYTKIKKFSEVDIHISLNQRKLINNLLYELGAAESIFSNVTDNIDISILLMNLINLEGQRSSLIEGTLTQFENLSYDFEGIHDKDQWENRNLISLYKKVYNQIDDDIWFLSTDQIKTLHIGLYEKNISKKFKLMFDPSLIIKKIKPGKIISNDDTPNWIGSKKTSTIEEVLNKATLIPIKPSLKIEYLDDLTAEINEKMENKTLLIEDIIKFYPIFEAIHPFADGNGRIGRLILTSLFKSAGFGRKIIINLSDEIYKDRETFNQKLNHVQLTNEWSDWIYYFINLLIKVKQNTIAKIRLLNREWNRFSRDLFFSVNKSRVMILTLYFKHYKLHKSHTIKHLQNKGIPQAQAYRSFKEVGDKIGAIKEENSNYYTFEKINEIMTTN